MEKVQKQITEYLHVVSSPGKDEEVNVKRRNPIYKESTAGVVVIIRGLVWGCILSNSASFL